MSLRFLQRMIKKKRSNTLYLRSYTRCPFHEPRPDVPPTPSNGTTPGHGPAGVARPNMQSGERRRLRRGSHVFPASAAHSQVDRRLRCRPLRSCGSPARTSPPVSEQERTPPPNAIPGAINATARRERGPSRGGGAQPSPGHGFAARPPAFAGLLFCFRPLSRGTTCATSAPPRHVTAASRSRAPGRAATSAAARREEPIGRALWRCGSCARRQQVCFILLMMMMWTRHGTENVSVGAKAPSHWPLGC